jgi:hypothetical protein
MANAFAAEQAGKEKELIIGDLRLVIFHFLNSRSPFANRQWQILFAAEQAGNKKRNWLLVICHFWGDQVGGSVLMCESPDEEPVRVMNPSGVEIDLPFWVFKRLKKLHLLERDPATGKRRICRRVFGLMEIWEAPEFRPSRALRSLFPGPRFARPKHKGFSNHFLKALGRDCSGIAWNEKWKPIKQMSRKFIVISITNALAAEQIPQRNGYWWFVIGDFLFFKIANHQSPIANSKFSGSTGHWAKLRFGSHF